MTINYNGTTYTLTRAQLEGLRQAALTHEGVFIMDRRNDKTDAHLASLGILAEDYVYREQEERETMRTGILESLETARTNTRAGCYHNAACHASAAIHALQGLHRTRHYLTETGYAIVLQQFPMAVVMLPARFSHLAPVTQEVK